MSAEAAKTPVCAKNDESCDEDKVFEWAHREIDRWLGDRRQHRRDRGRKSVRNTDEGQEGTNYRSVSGWFYEMNMV